MNELVSRAEQADLFCADLSRETGEQMAGTAPVAETWFLLEYSGPWTAKATEDNDLPSSTRAWLAEALALVEGGRVQFIKQTRTTPASGITFFLALAREVDPLLYEFHFNSYADLDSLDLAGILDGDAGRQHLRSEPLYLVCTNGRRDRCCARWGLGLYLALDELVGDAARQTTHLGGHRFAPTMVAFPNGVCYGRLAAADLPPLVRAQEDGRLHLSHLRGRCCYADVVQAADWFLRQETGLRAGDDYRLLDAQPQDGDRWRVRFMAPLTGRVYPVLLSRTLPEPPRLVSCSPAKTKTVPRFNLVSISQEA